MSKKPSWPQHVATVVILAGVVLIYFVRNYPGLPEIQPLVDHDLGLALGGGLIAVGAVLLWQVKK